MAKLVRLRVAAAAVAALAWVGASAGTVPAAVRVVAGPTPIEDGEARAADDLTVSNDKLAFSLAVGTPVPYGVPRGALIDLAPVTDGRVGRDCVVFADFVPNNWSAWPNTYSRVKVLESGPARAVVRSERDWGRVAVTTLYTLEAGADSVRMETTLENRGATLSGLLSGPTLWPKRGFFFGLPGLDGQRSGATAGAFARTSFAYDEDWSVALHAPSADRFADGGMDLWTSNALRAGQRRTFLSWLQVGARGDLAPVVRAEIARDSMPSGNVQGRVHGRGGAAIDLPVVVAERGGKPFAWFMGNHGRYRAALPAGSYELYATGRNTSQSGRVPLEVRAGKTEIRDFHDLSPPGVIRFEASDARGAPLDARIAILEGQTPVVEFLGRRTFFTELERKGRAEVPIAPGAYRFSVSADGGFLSERREVRVDVAPGRGVDAKVGIVRLFDPPARHWYAADLHHHSDRSEAVTPPADLARSQLAAGLDLLFVSDHDSTANHAVLEAIGRRRGIPFIAGMELSPSWGHFNAYPLAPGAVLSIDTATAPVSAIFAEARRLGAAVIQVNHPFIPYGYFTSVASGSAPGGFDPSFDLLEINAEEAGDDAKVAEAAWKYWNEGKHYFLAGGTDTHDAWRHESGEVRTFAHVETLGANSFAQALKNGAAYVTHGPLIDPAIPFGATLSAAPRAAIELAFDLESIEGLRRVDLIERGVRVDFRAFTAVTRREHVVFAPRPAPPTWYSVVVEDRRGHKAYSDPIWVAAADAAGR